jgi:hypothetical protein
MVEHLGASFGNVFVRRFHGGDRIEMLFAAVRWSLMAHSGQSNRPCVCPLLDQSGQRWIFGRDGLSAYDPTATLAVHCGNGFNAGFSLYQSTRLSR